MKNIIFITKDALRCNALSVYGKSPWCTPNIDELAKKGTVFNRHYTAGGSTAMAFTCMATGLYCYETGRKLYDGKESSIKGSTLFDKMYERGYDVHIAWDISYTEFAKAHFKCEGLHTTIHSLNTIIPHHSPHIAGKFDDLTYKDKETENALNIIENLFKDMVSLNRKIFLWLHLPHVLSGRNSYESDIDCFDRIIGYARNYFQDDEIYISADHGNMNGHKGKFSYGYDLEENVMRIPLITPKFMGKDVINVPTINTQLDEIFGVSKFKQREYVISETAYYVQPKRKVAIVLGNYKLIYDKETKKFELYDVIWDEAEELNLYYPEFYDVDRESWFSLNQRFYYPYWEEANLAKEKLMNVYDSVWENGTFIEEMYQFLLFKIKLFVKRVTRKKRINSIVNIGK